MLFASLFWPIENTAVALLLPPPTEPLRSDPLYSLHFSEQVKNIGRQTLL